jgi:hypothetical protein
VRVVVGLVGVQLRGALPRPAGSAARADDRAGSRRPAGAAG